MSFFMPNWRKPVTDDTLWPIYSRNEPRYFILNGELRGVGHGPRATACAFWNEFMPLISARQSKQIGTLFPPMQRSHLLILLSISLSLLSLLIKGMNECNHDGLISKQGSASIQSPSLWIFPIILCLLMVVWGYKRSTTTHKEKEREEMHFLNADRIMTTASLRSIPSTKTQSSTVFWWPPLIVVFFNALILFFKYPHIIIH